MHLRIILTVISLSSTKQIHLLDHYTVDNDCHFNWTRAQAIVLYKPTVNYIMKMIQSPPIADDLYEKYSLFIDKFGPRISGSPTLERAIDYMINLTFESGFNDVTTENLTVPHWMRGYESLRMILPRANNLTILGLGLSVPTSPVGITAEVIVVNSFKELEAIDYRVIGKIVLLNIIYTTFTQSVKYQLHCATMAARKGASAVLLRSSTPFSLYTPHTGSLKYAKSIRKIPAAEITLEDADFLQRVYNRGERIVVNLKMFNTFDVKVSRNTIIDLKGEETPEKLIIVSGHIDSWDVGRGAVDNGGGMMISWFVPVILNYLSLTPKRTIRSILWTSNELGYNGAASYLKKHLNELPNIDFVMESDAGTFEPLGLEVAGSEKTRCLIGNILKLFAPIDVLKNANTTGSDISLFVEKGIPGATLLNVNELFFSVHHSQADTLTVQNKTNFVNCAAFWAAVSYVIADIPFEIPR